MKAVILAAVLLATPALAQPARAPDVVKTYIDPAEIQALIANAKTMPPKPLISQRMVSLAPNRGSLEYRFGEAASASVHVNDAELMVVIQGSGKLLVGGTLVGASGNGANQTGSSISGGTTLAMTPGTINIVPENTPHQLIPDPGVALVLMTMRLPGAPPAAAAAPAAK